MPRLTSEQVKQGLLHPDQDARFAALRYFVESYSPDQSVMPVVIEAFERYGRTEAFKRPLWVTSLAQSDATIRWAIEELKTQPDKTREQVNYRTALWNILAEADPGLVAPHESDILTIPTAGGEVRYRVIGRLKYLTWDGEALWQELHAICYANQDDPDNLGDIRWDVGADVVEELGRRGETQVQRTLEFLKQNINVSQESPLAFLESFVVQLAGELRLEAAIPLIIGRLQQEDGSLHEEATKALIRIGTDATIQAIRDAYPAAGSRFRAYAGGVLGGVHTDLAVSTLIEFLASVNDLDQENELAKALVSHFSIEGNEVARKVLLSDPDLGDLQRKLVTACILMGQDFPELAAWRQELEEERKPRTAPDPVRPITLPPPPPPMRSVISQVFRTEKQVGRNDPCPCGSGKKFKKCCGGKHPT